MKVNDCSPGVLFDWKARGNKRSDLSEMTLNGKVSKSNPVRACRYGRKELLQSGESEILAVFVICRESFRAD